MVALPLTLDLKGVHLTDEQFFQLCVANSDIRAEGTLVLIPPVDGYSSNVDQRALSPLILSNSIVVGKTKQR